MKNNKIMKQLVHLGSTRPTARAAPLAMTRVPMKKVESRRRLAVFTINYHRIN